MTERQDDDGYPRVDGPLDMTVAVFKRRCLIQLRDQLESPQPNQTLIALLCDAVRLARKHATMIKGLEDAR